MTTTQTATKLTDTELKELAERALLREFRADADQLREAASLVVTQ